MDQVTIRLMQLALTSIREIEANWESGDLARAVNELSTVAENIELWIERQGVEHN
jgi:hypothetical protein